MKKILEKSGNFIRGKKWEPWSQVCELPVWRSHRYVNTLSGDLTGM